MTGYSKQQLLKQHRRNKRLAMVGVLLAIAILAFLLGWWLLPTGLLLAWVVNEAWFADHIFYPASADYQYEFGGYSQQLPLQIVDGQLLLSAGHGIGAEDSLILQVRLKTKWTGYLFDPLVQVGSDRQTFERGAQGIRYLNLTGRLVELEQGLRLSGKFCQLETQVQLWAFPAIALADKNIMILAPHADDAELAAFSICQQHAARTSVVTLTQGEIEANNYQNLGLSSEQAASLKGRLRSWDSMAIPQWAGIPQTNCVQLGYYCMQLTQMQQQPEISFGSKESGEQDIRTARWLNKLQLPSDTDGSPTWHNLIADLKVCLEHFQPQVIVLPHPQLDPHQDHIATVNAIEEALSDLTHQPEFLLHYTNHLHDNDRWPMGATGTGVALPPVIGQELAQPLTPQALLLSTEQQIDKAMALQMQHDLRPALPLKRKLRRIIQHVLLGRRWPASGENEFMRKAVRRHELLWLSKRQNRAQQPVSSACSQE